MSPHSSKYLINWQEMYYLLWGCIWHVDLFLQMCSGLVFRGWRGSTTVPVWWGNPKWPLERPSAVLYRKSSFPTLRKNTHTHSLGNQVFKETLMHHKRFMEFIKHTFQSSGQISLLFFYPLSKYNHKAVKRVQNSVMATWWIPAVCLYLEFNFLTFSDSASVSAASAAL